MTILFTILLLISDLIETTYDLGVTVRRYGVPAVVYIYCIMERAYDQLTSLDMTLDVQDRRGLGFAGM